jgi:hypothetical protein
MLSLTNETKSAQSVEPAAAAQASQRSDPYALMHQRGQSGDLWHTRGMLHDVASGFAQWLSMPKEAISSGRRVVNGYGLTANTEGPPHTDHIFHVDLASSIVVALTCPEKRVGAMVAFHSDDDRVFTCADELYDHLDLAGPPNSHALHGWLACGPDVSEMREHLLREAIGTDIDIPVTTVRIRELGDDEAGVILDVKGDRFIAFKCTREARHRLLTQYDAPNARFARVLE